MFIEINNLKKSFGSDSNRVEVLRGVDFSIEKGDICVLLGPSGSGKSTLLNMTVLLEMKNNIVSVSWKKSKRYRF